MSKQGVECCTLKVKGQSSKRQRVFMHQRPLRGWGRFIISGFPEFDNWEDLDDHRRYSVQSEEVGNGCDTLSVRI